MNYDDTMRSAFLDELTKIAAAKRTEAPMIFEFDRARIEDGKQPIIGSIGHNAGLLAGAGLGALGGHALGQKLRIPGGGMMVLGGGLGSMLGSAAGHRIHSALLDERTKTAEAAQNPPAPLTTKQKVLAALLGGPGGYLGAVKGARHGEAVEGAVRGAGGAMLGGMAGGMAGVSLGALAQKALPSSVPAGLVPALGRTVGNIGGQIAGYRALTRKYNAPSTEA